MAPPVISERQLLLAVQRGIKDKKAPARAVAQALNLSCGYDEIHRVLDRALQRARKRGLIRFDKTDRSWLLTADGESALTG